MKRVARLLALVLGAALAVAAPHAVLAQGETIGVVVMHGKGGLPTRHVLGLASGLEREGYRVANLEMPWSGSNHFKLPVARADEMIVAAIADLRAGGAKKIFVAGHSLGGTYALYVGSRHPVDGVIAIAPGGSVGNATFRASIAPALDRARELVAEGKGNDTATLQDYEGGRGNYPISTIPANYLAWHDVEGPMNTDRSVPAVKVPVLFIIPRRDYPGLLKSSPVVFRKLPANPRTRLYEPDADHLGAPYASVGEIVKWTKEVAK